jgi:hypothetical protein
LVPPAHRVRMDCLGRKGLKDLQVRQVRKGLPALQVSLGQPAHRGRPVLEAIQAHRGHRDLPERKATLAPPARRARSGRKGIPGLPACQARRGHVVALDLRARPARWVRRG